MKTVNKFEIKGRIGSISRRTNGESKFFINSYINKRDVNLLITTNIDIPDDIENNDAVIVSGYITAMPQELRRNERYKNIFHATSIEKSPSEMEKEFKVSGSYQSPDYFKASFKGFVGNTRKLSDDWGKLTLVTDVGVATRNPSKLSLDYQLKNNMYSNLPEFNFEYNEPVYVICSIATSSKIINGEKVFFQDLKVEDIQKIQ